MKKAFLFCALSFLPAALSAGDDQKLTTKLTEPVILYHGLSAETSTQCFFDGYHRTRELDTDDKTVNLNDKGQMNIVDNGICCLSGRWIAEAALLIAQKSLSTSFAVIDPTHKKLKKD